jgi:hypothetical protein
MPYRAKVMADSRIKMMLSWLPVMFTGFTMHTMPAKLAIREKMVSLSMGSPRRK